MNKVQRNLVLMEYFNRNFMLLEDIGMLEEEIIEVMAYSCYDDLVAVDNRKEHVIVNTRNFPFGTSKEEQERIIKLFHEAFDYIAEIELVML